MYRRRRVAMPQRIGHSLALLCLASVLWPTAASACPYCQSEIGQEVSAGIFNGDFWRNAVLTLLPVPVLLLIVAAIHFGFPSPRQLVPARMSQRTTPSAEEPCR